MRGSAPGADRTFSVFGAAAVMPCRMVTTSSALPCARHEPSADRPSVASWPITATLRSLSAIQRQQLALVLEQHHGLARNGARGLAMFGREQLARFALGVVVLHRLVEQAELFFHAQDAQYRLVELLEARGIFRDGVLQIVGKHAAHHVHVHRRIEREHAGGRAIRRDAMIESSPIAPQSLTMSPCQPQRSRSRPRSRSLLAVVGTPAMSLNAAMNEPAPARAAA